MTTTTNSDRFAVGTNYTYNDDPRHKRFMVSIWSPPFCSTHEAEAFALPSGGAWSMRPDVAPPGAPRVRVVAPTPRTDENYQEVDAALCAALSAWYDANGYVSIGSAQ